ncbi:hypothetical protein M8C21_032360, partial [Ambrosia artemisiifolia]
MEDHGGGLRRRPLVVLTSSPFHGHMTPTLQLATTLHAKGFPIAIAHSSLNPPNPSNHPSDFTFCPLSDNLSAIQEQSGGFAKFINTLNNNCKASFKEHLTRLISDGNKSMVVIYDNIMYMAGVVAVELNLTGIMFRTSSAAFFPALLVRQQIRQQGRFLEEDFVMQEVVPNHHPLSQQAHPSAVIWNTIEFLEHESLTQAHTLLKVPVFAIGPLHKITPSSSIGPHQEDTEWLELLPKEFVEETRECGLIVKWAPQKDVLAHFAVGGFWSHCGWNSCLESISSGVVMICQPFIVDQMVNARYVSHVWKIRLELERVERGEVEEIIRRVMVSDEGEGMRIRVNNMKEMVKKTLENNGSSQESLE